MLRNILRVGVIAEVDYGQPVRYRVEDGLDDAGEPFLSDWLYPLMSRAFNDVESRLYEQGEQVGTFQLPGCDIGFVIGSVEQAGHERGARDPDITRHDFKNGAYVEHNRATGALTVLAKSAVIIKEGNVIVEDGHVVVKKGSVTVEQGDVTVSDGSINVPNGDVIASGVSLVEHLHVGVSPGTGKTGSPE